MKRITTLAELKGLDPRDFDNIVLSQEDILGWLALTEAGWMHSGNPAMPHVELTSGLCSSGFFFCRKLLRYPNITEILAIQLAKKMEEILPAFDAVVGSPYSSITLSYEVAKYFKVPHGIPEKDPSDPKGKRMVWKEEFPAGTRVLRIEELVTTASSTQEIARAILEKNPHPVLILPMVGVLVHRPPQIPADYWNMQMVSLVEKEIWAVPQEKCDLCAQGSKRVKPKLIWAQLVGHQ